MLVINSSFLGRKQRMPDPAELFETWLLRRVAEAVEAGEVSADLLADIHAAMAETRGQSPDERHAVALIELAERVNLPVNHVTELLMTLPAQPPTARARFLRRFVEAWLMRQRAAHDADRPGANDG